jgi:alpha-L-fucosidase
MAKESKLKMSKPSPAQLAWQDLEVGMFIHFAPNTWQDSQHDNLATPLSAINPASLDVRQWVDVAESMRARYIIFVAKHVGGFCMWPTETTRYSIAGTPWREGKGDVCGDLAEECRRRNMPLGFYVSPRDDHFGAAEGGRARSDMPAHQALYDRVYKRQLTELLTRYGELVEVWFDGSANGRLVAPLIKKHQPDAMVFQTSAATIRWIGNEDGVAPYPTWNTVPAGIREWTPDLEAQAGPRPEPSEPTLWLPAECDVPIRKDWFWTRDNIDSLKSLDQLMDIYYRTVGHGCNLLLNHTPDPSGLIPEPDAHRAAEFGAEVIRRFGAPLASTSGAGRVLELVLDLPAEIDHVVMMEEIREGERVLEYQVEVLAEDGWRKVAQGSAVGHKKIDRIVPVIASRVRLSYLQSIGTPVMRSFAVYGSGAAGR